LERQASINEDIIRYLTIRVEAHENQPSIMMRKQERRPERGDRSDRGERGERGGHDRDEG
jgi:small subunit ribosomal protein S6